MKIILDCNVVISAGLTSGTCRNALIQVLSHHSNYISDEIVREYRDVIFRKKFEIYRSCLVQLLESICITSTWVQDTIGINEFKLPDPGGQKYLDLALSVSADFLITGNLKDFPLINYRSLKILSPKEFLDIHNIK